MINVLCVFFANYLQVYAVVHISNGLCELAIFSRPIDTVTHAYQVECDIEVELISQLISHDRNLLSRGFLLIFLR